MNFRTLFVVQFIFIAAFATKADNLFNSLLGKSDEEVDARINQVWEHFFTPADLSRYEEPNETSVYYE